MTQEQINKWLDRHKKAKGQKTKWLDLWQYVGKYVHTRKQNFTEFQDEGNFLNEDIFDSTAPKANRKMAAALLGLLWQSGAKSIRINPSSSIQIDAEVKEYFEEISRRVIRAVDDPRAGLTLALEEYMMDQGCFGTSGVGCFEGDESDLRFQAWGVDEICIEEGEHGFIRTIFREYKIPVSRAVADFGEENVSEKTLEAYKDGRRSEMVRYLHIVAPSEERDAERPFLSLYIEMDVKKMVKKSGFFEMPVSISRFYKRRNEIYGRSPAMEALPDILELNATKEARISAIEKSLDPPLGVYDDSLLGNEEVDTSAGGLNVFATSGRIANQNPIFPLFTVETIREADKSIEDLVRSINEHFSIDRLLDFNNETRMTLGEAQMRQQIRSEALGSLFSRQQNELFTPLVERCVNVLFRMGRLGVMRGSEEEAILLQKGEEPYLVPDAVAEMILSGKDFYEIEYITPASRMMDTTEAAGVLRAWEFASFIGQFSPDVYDMLDADESLKVIARSEGAPGKILVSDEIVEQIRAAKAEQMRRQLEMEQGAQQVQGAEMAAKASQEVSRAQQEEEAAGGQMLPEVI